MWQPTAHYLNPFCPLPPCPPPSHNQQVAGLRNDGKTPAAYIADTTTANAQVGATLPRACVVAFVCSFQGFCVAGRRHGRLTRTCAGPLALLPSCRPPTHPCRSHPPLATRASPPAHPAQVRSLGETVRLDARTKLLNPKWYEGMLSRCVWNGGGGRGGVPAGTWRNHARR